MFCVLLLKTCRGSLKLITEQVARASPLSNSALDFFVLVINHTQSSFSQPFIKLIHDPLYERYSAGGWEVGRS